MILAREHNEPRASKGITSGSESEAVCVLKCHSSCVKRRKVWGSDNLVELLADRPDSEADHLHGLVSATHTS